MDDLEDAFDEIMNKLMFEELLEKFGANKEEIARAKTELPVIKPTEGRPEQYLQLKEILIKGFKRPQTDENGYCASLPILTCDTPVLDFGLYTMVSFRKFDRESSLYSRLIDEPMILFREHDRKIILCLLPKDNSIGVKLAGLEGFSLNPEYQNEFNLEYIYLLMRHEKFTKQFPKGMNGLSILNGWIPKMDYPSQQKTILSLRKKVREELSEGLDILS